jgi:exonuclease III
MMEKKEKNPLPRASVSGLTSPGHRIPGDQGHHGEKNRSFSNSLKCKNKHYIGTLNVNTLFKPGKLKQLTDTMEKFKIKILAIQETRFIDQNHFDTENHRIYKGKPAVQHNGGPKQFGTAFVVHKSIRDSVIDFNSASECISTLSLKSANKAYTLINTHAPTNEHNRKNPQKVDDFWDQLEETTNKIPKHHVKILLGDFNAQLGRERNFRKITGIHTAHKRTNKNGERLINFCEIFNLKIMSTQFQKPTRKLYTWKSPNTTLGEFQIDHTAISKNNSKEILNVNKERVL